MTATPSLQADLQSWIAATRAPEALRLGVPGFAYADLFDPAKLAELYAAFDQEFARRDPAAHATFAAYRGCQGDGMDGPAISRALVAAAPHVSAFVAQLFGVEGELAALVARATSERPLWAFKKDFSKKRLFKADAGKAFAGAPEAAASIARAALVALGADAAGLGRGDEDEEVRLARAALALVEVDDVARKAVKAGGVAWSAELHERAARVRAAVIAHPRAAEAAAVAGASPTDAEDHRVVALALDALEAWLLARRADPRDGARDWSSLHAPEAVDHGALVQLRRPDPALPELFVGPEGHRRERHGFELSDPRCTPREAAAEVDYCLLCHDRDKDSCAKGLVDAKTGAIKHNPLGVPLAGCPLDEKIGEMHEMRAVGDSLAALALIALDNPMCPGTGHRICNDCMKACVFQKQEPVDIPQVETAVLVDVLRMRWGFEIYGFLTRWNPLDVRRPHALPYNGKNVLVVGLGPAGYTLSHHLTREGFAVAAIDGLKIEPLPVELTGSAVEPPRPIERFGDLEVALGERILLGFGGVSEYGITVRWDKNFLTVLYVTLARQRLMRVYGGVRFGGTVTLEDAWQMGFDHVAIAAGAGRPTIVEMKNNLARGIRKASDFLMGLQLTGAAKPSSLANLQVRLPAVVIGGGLTAIDTATELLAYYVVQVEKTADRLRTLFAEQGEAAVLARFDAEERGFLVEQLAHADAIDAERASAAREGREPKLQPLLDAWGGVHLVYRKSVVDSPAYRLNHEEVIKSLEEGVRYVENMAPVEALLDEGGAVRAMRFERQRLDAAGKWRGSGEMLELPARTVCVAAGTSPNTMYAKERPGALALDRRGQFFQAHRAVLGEGGKVSVEKVDDPKAAFFTSYCDGVHTVSYYGDNHPHYAGSVVKAMASARDGVRLVAPVVLHAGGPAEGRGASPEPLFNRLDDDLIARVHHVERLTPQIVELVVHAPAAARKFEPGQFYRLQNYEQFARVVDGTRLAMEGVALTGAWVDKERGLLSLIVLEMGSSSRLVATLTPGERVVVMGPTGAPTEVPEGGETVLLCGGGLGNAVLFSIARAFKASGARVLYFAAYKNGADVFKRDEVEAGTDVVVWCTDAGAEVEPRRPLDRHFRGNIVQAMAAYGRGELGGAPIALADVRRIIAIGSDRMMAAVRDARHGVLAPMLDPRHVGIGSINSPMQCMMKEVCAQCLQRHVDPRTGKETIVFTCMNQDQELDHVDFQHLAARLRANSAEEKLGAAWFERLLAKAPASGRV